MEVEVEVGDGHDDEKTCQVCEAGDIVWSKAHQAYRCPECGTEEVDE